MDTRTYTRYEMRARMLKALAHPARLFIVDELSSRERCVNELAGMIGVDTSTVSRHLSVLKNAGIVRCRRKGPQVFYSLRVPCVLNFFLCIESVMESVAREHLDLME